MLPVIGIVERKEMNGDFKQIIVHQEYVDAIIEFGGNPLLITSKEKFTRKEKKRLLTSWLDMCDGIVLPGGEDEFQEEDYFILDYAIKKKLPLLGICLGMQEMALYKGKDKLENIVGIGHKQSDNYVHSVILNKNSRLSYILKNASLIKVNSRHKQCVKNSGQFEVSGKSEDGIIECLENPNHRFQIGVQWHPESMITYDENSRELWKTFIKECKKNKE